PRRDGPPGSGGLRRRLTSARQAAHDLRDVERRNPRRNRRVFLADLEGLGSASGTHHTEAPHALRVGDRTEHHHAPFGQQRAPVCSVPRHHVLLLGRQRLLDVRPRRQQPEQEQLVAHDECSAARVAGCTAIKPNPLRRLHIAASSAYAFSPSSSVSSAESDSHTCFSPMCTAGSPVQYQCKSAPPSPQPRRSNSVIVVLRISYAVFCLKK